MLRRLIFALGLCLMLSLPGSLQAERVHTVRSGQSLARIARRYRVSVTDLRYANRLRRNARLRPGQRLNIPDRFETYVRPGDTITRIARRHDVDAQELARVNRLRRNSRLRAGRKLMLPGYVPQADRNRDWGTPDTPGLVTVARRGERRQLQLVDAQGRVLREGLRGLGEIMRRHEDDPLREPNPRLAWMLARISDHFGGRPITLVSGWRAEGGRTAATSRHVSGRASDIRIRGVGNRTLWEFCRRTANAGCGFYPRSTFVHIDARQRRTQWVDWSRPGRRARYGTLRGPRRRNRRRMPFPRQNAELPFELEIVEADGSVTAWTDHPETESADLEDEEQSDAAPESTDEGDVDEDNALADEGSTNDDETAADAGEAAAAEDDAPGTDGQGTDAEAQAE